LNIADLPLARRFRLHSEDEVIRQINNSSGRSLWRGMGDSMWCPKASIDVFMQLQGLVDKRATLTRLRDEFSQSLELLDLPRPENDDEFWALAQHFGVPSTLVDWTASPWIALYFACIGSAKPASGQKMVLFRLRPDGVPTIETSDLSLFQPKYTARNKRLPAQLGLFTRSTDACFLESLTKLGLVDQLEVYSFPATLARPLMRRLVDMNIRARTMFPDVAGAVQDAKDVAAWLT
jgi:FRG domain